MDSNGDRQSQQKEIHVKLYEKVHKKCLNSPCNIIHLSADHPCFFAMSNNTQKIFFLSSIPLRELNIVFQEYTYSFQILILLSITISALLNINQTVTLKCRFPSIVGE